jgi:hypothetical protein
MLSRHLCGETEEEDHENPINSIRVIPSWDITPYAVLWKSTYVSEEYIDCIFRVVK